MCDGHKCRISMSINVITIKCTLIPVKVTFSLSVNVLCNKYRLAFIHSEVNELFSMLVSL